MGFVLELELEVEEGDAMIGEEPLLVVVVLVVIVDVELLLLVATFSQEGHIVNVVAGNCMKNGLELLLFKALNS